MNFLIDLDMISSLYVKVSRSYRSFPSIWISKKYYIIKLTIFNIHFLIDLDVKSALYVQLNHIHYSFSH